MPSPPSTLPKMMPALMPEDEDSSCEEELEEPRQFWRPRKGGVSAVPMWKGYYKEPYWNKHAYWDEILFNTLRCSVIFKQFTDIEVSKFVRAMETHLRYDGDIFVEQGERADSAFVVLSGSLACYTGDNPAPIKILEQGAMLDGVSVLFAYPRKYLLKARGECILAKLCHHDYVNLATRFKFYKREQHKMLLKGAKMLEMMEDEAIEKLCDSLTLKTYEPGVDIIRQHEEGREFYIVNSGTVRVWVKTADDEQEYVRLHTGDLFGELALLKNAPRAASVTAVNKVTVLCLTRKQFERQLGPMTELHQQQYLTDPRKLIADFYEVGDGRGPSGSLLAQGLEPDPVNFGETTWFAVYRPTSKDAIAKMLSGAAVGKGLNVKGKSAKKGVLSGFVPFIQISENEHKQLIEQSPNDSRVVVYYKTKAAREEARKALQAVLDSSKLDIMDRSINNEDSYKPDTWGLDMPEPLMREGYIMKPDISPVMGWETGRRSEPAFMDMNLHAIRGKSDPQVVLYQNDESEAMNPRGLLVAYAEAYVKPVVSDFDTFTVGSRNMDYESLPLDQAKLISWCLGHTKDILGSLDHQSWNSRWLEVLAKENERGFHPTIPKYGFGDPTSIRLIKDVIAETSGCGAIRHGAECCNLYFPQELDDEYLIVWHGFPDKPWDYKTEDGLKKFLTERVKEGYAFPINAVWPVRDKGWYELLETMMESPSAKKALLSWFPPEINYFEHAEALHKQFPSGFMIVQK
eukprot:TRINITY_DN9866_c0_g1_i4.p1 TRINITY_DN9866_c0_g1~~TRINITY_DN9866_c0_g1_i4.p1  ORF type:complete len:744 (-),score=157.52 TRINITY_DN9866_c0_g1_i4:31-2262(-)